MKLIIKKIGCSSISSQEYQVSAFKGASDKIAFNISGTGWRAIELKDIDSYELQEDSNSKASNNKARAQQAEK